MLNPFASAYSRPVPSFNVDAFDVNVRQFAREDEVVVAVLAMPTPPKDFNVDSCLRPSNVKS